VEIPEFDSQVRYAVKPTMRKGPASQYAGRDDVTYEFNNGHAVSGLISLLSTPDGMRVDLYRLDKRRTGGGVPMKRTFRQIRITIAAASEVAFGLSLGLDLVANHGKSAPRAPSDDQAFTHRMAYDADAAHCQDDLPYRVDHDTVPEGTWDSWLAAWWNRQPHDNAEALSRPAK
jgi:hypothetical protein